MKQIKRAFWILCVSLSISFIASFSYAESNSSPVGYWWQISDKTGQVHSIMQIWQDGNQLKGKVAKGFPDPGKQLQVYCYKCPGDFKDKQIVGLPIIWNLSFDQNSGRWTGGSILDPDSGKIYNVNMTLTDGGNQLIVRGYIGISLLGRSQTWYRIPAKQVVKALKSNTPPEASSVK